MNNVTSGQGKPTDVRVVGTQLYLLPHKTRMPLKFGPETLTSVTCARVRVTVADRAGREAVGWGETPLSVQWAWPSTLPYAPRHEAMKAFCVSLAEAWSRFDGWGHPLELGHDFLHEVLPRLRAGAAGPGPELALPYLAALICNSAFDIALHDAYGMFARVRRVSNVQRPLPEPRSWPTTSSRSTGRS